MSCDVIFLLKNLEVKKQIYLIRKLPVILTWDGVCLDTKWYCRIDSDLHLEGKPIICNPILVSQGTNLIEFIHSVFNRPLLLKLLEQVKSKNMSYLRFIMCTYYIQFMT